jgi:hypothetical protein
MELSIRKLQESDWDTLVSWWSEWKEWGASPPRDFLPENGTGGIMVSSGNKPIVAGFLYFTNSKGVLLEWIISDPKYKENNRKEALELLINTAEQISKDKGFKYIFTIGRNKHLIKTHEKLGYTVDKNPSYEISKKIN